MALRISRKVSQKLANKQPPVTEDEIEQCFANRNTTYLEDDREEHRTDPPTQWFIGETDYGRKLKIVFIRRGEEIAIRTAYDPNEIERYIYQKYSRPA